MVKTLVRVALKVYKFTPARRKALQKAVAASARKRALRTSGKIAALGKAKTKLLARGVSSNYNLSRASRRVATLGNKHAKLQKSIARLQNKIDKPSYIRRALKLNTPKRVEAMRKNITRLQERSTKVSNSFVNSNAKAARLNLKNSSIINKTAKLDKRILTLQKRNERLNKLAQYYADLADNTTL